MEDFHDDPFCRSILANLLIRTEREEPAEHVLRETMRRLPHDTVSRYTLTSMLWRQGRRGDAETVMAALLAMAPDDAHVRTLAVRIREQRPISAEFAESELTSIYDNAGIRQDLGVWEAHRKELRTSWPWHSESGPTADETGMVGDGSIVATYLSRLEYRTGLLERFFASSKNGTGGPRSAVAHDERSSELALVAAHRAGLLDGVDRRKELHTWIEAHPSSYSVRLLLLWRGTESSGPDSAALSAIEREFPEHRKWTERLSHAFNSRVEHGGLLRKVIGDGSVPGSDSWASRLVAVNPSLMTQQDDAPSRFDSAAWRRLMEDIAFAGAERALPSIAPRY